jgi:hypothetical protein
MIVGLALGAHEAPSPWRHDVVAWPGLSWDFSWYWSLATNGYPTVPHASFAFFPFWPAFLHVLDLVADAPAVAALVVAPVLSLVAFLGTANTNPSGHRTRTAIALACVPGSWALLLPAPDAVALAAGTWACVLAIRGRPLAAGLLGVVAATARPSAFLLAIPLGSLAWHRRRELRLWWTAPLGPLLGIVGVQAFFWIRSGDPTVYAHAAVLWNRNHPLGVFRVIFDVAQNALHGHVNDNTANLAILLVYLALLVFLFRAGPQYRMWALYSGAVLAVPVASGAVVGIGRYALQAFPLVWIAADGPRWLRHPAVVAPAAVISFALALSLGYYQP